VQCDAPKEAPAVEARKTKPSAAQVVK
jgi:hypothetical protein